MLIARLAEIVGFAHRLSPPIVHRDLKPANVLVKRNADNKMAFRIADFGIGAVAANCALEKTKAGNTRDLILTKRALASYTPLYASPQQMRGEPPDPRDDVYSLGIIWYQMVTGDLTTGTPSGLQWTTALVRRGMNADQVQLMASCFESTPGDRPADAAELFKLLSKTIQAKSAATLAPPSLQTMQGPLATGQPSSSTSPGSRTMMGELVPAPQSDNRTVMGELLATQVQVPTQLSSLSPATEPLECQQRADGNIQQKKADGFIVKLIPYRNPKALIAYYVGVFALIPSIGLVLGLVAAIVGIVGARQAVNRPATKGLVHAIVGIVLGILALVGNLLLWIVSPGLFICFLLAMFAGFTGNDLYELMLRYRSTESVHETKGPSATTEEPAITPIVKVDQAKLPVVPAAPKKPDIREPAVTPIPQAAIDCFERGVTAYNSKDVDQAIAEFTQAIRLAPSFGDSFRNRGRCYLTKQDYKTARDDLTKAILLNAKDAQAFLWRAEVNLADSRPDEAIRDCTQVLMQFPDNLAAFNIRGDAHFARNNTEEALADYTQLIRHNPKDETGYRKRAYTYLMIGNGSRSAEAANTAWEKAVLDCDETLRLTPENPLAYETRCWAHFNLGNIDKSLADCDQLIRLAPKNYMGYRVRGMAYETKNNTKQAVADYTQAINLNPEDNVSLRLRGIRYFYLRNFEQAAVDLTKAIDLHLAVFKYSDGEAHYYRGRAYNMTKNYDAAIADFTLAIKIDPKFAKAYYHRSLSYNAKGDKVRAKNDYSRAIKMDPNVAKE